MSNRKSKELKQAHGTYRADRNKPAPEFDPGPISRPRYLKGLARKEWDAVVPYLKAKKVITPVDISLAASYCQMFAFYMDAVADIEQRGSTIMVTSTTRTGRTDKPFANPSVDNAIRFHAAMVKVGTKLGLSPLDRPKIIVPPDETPDDDNDIDGDNGL